LEQLWKKAKTQISHTILVNCFQLLPSSIVMRNDVEKWFFIDQTLHQLFSEYGIAQSIGSRIAKDAVVRERHGYQAAKGIIAHSRWAAQSVAKDYGIPSERIHVIVPGANIDADLYSDWEKRCRSTDHFEVCRPLRLVFVGKEWKRKGLDTLTAALQIARSSGSDVTIRVIGCDPNTVPAQMRQVDGIEWAGFIDKAKEPYLFIEKVASCDVGCLLSKAEAGGIAYREYHALGLLVIGTSVGGTEDHMIRGCSIRLRRDITAERLADVIISLEADRTKFAEMRRTAWMNRNSARWSHSIRQLKKIWSDSIRSQIS
jgi:glycosyltransferase involved in cell wall biosynthesis